MPDLAQFEQVQPPHERPTKGYDDFVVQEQDNRPFSQGSAFFFASALGQVVELPFAPDVNQAQTERLVSRSRRTLARSGAPLRF
jgi:hypothetical protein